jgi:hypothetical protein
MLFAVCETCEYVISRFVYFLQFHIFLVKVIVLGRYLFAYKYYNLLLQVFLDGFGHVWLWILEVYSRKNNRFIFFRISDFIVIIQIKINYSLTNFRHCLLYQSKKPTTFCILDLISSVGGMGGTCSGGSSD